MFCCFCCCYMLFLSNYPNSCVGEGWGGVPNKSARSQENLVVTVVTVVTGHPQIASPLPYGCISDDLQVVTLVVTAWHCRCHCPLSGPVRKPLEPENSGRHRRHCRHRPPPSRHPPPCDCIGGFKSCLFGRHCLALSLSLPASSVVADKADNPRGELCTQ